MNDGEEATTLESISNVTVTLAGFMAFIYYGLGLIQMAGVFIFGRSTEGFQTSYLIGGLLVVSVAVMVSILIMWQSNWITDMLFSVEGCRKLTLDSPQLFLRILLIAISVVVLFGCLPPAIIGFVRYVTPSEQNIMYGTWMFQRGGYMINLFRSALAVVVFLFNRQIATWCFSGIDH